MRDKDTKLFGGLYRLYNHCSPRETMKKIFRNPLFLSLLISFLAIVLLICFEIKLGVDKEVIAISITGTTGFLGYFITHYIERERKKKEEKFSLYTDLMSSIRVMTTTSEDKTKAAGFTLTPKYFILKDTENFLNGRFFKYLYNFLMEDS